MTKQLESLASHLDSQISEAVRVTSFHYERVCFHRPRWPCHYGMGSESMRWLSPYWMNTSHQPVLFEIRSFYNIYLWDAKLVLCWLKQGIKDKIIGSLVFMTQMEVAVKTVLGGLKKKNPHISQARFADGSTKLKYWNNKINDNIAQFGLDEKTYWRELRGRQVNVCFLLVWVHPVALMMSQSTDRLSAEVNSSQGTSQNFLQWPRTGSSTQYLLSYTTVFPQPASCCAHNTVHLV